MNKVLHHQYRMNAWGGTRQLRVEGVLSDALSMSVPLVGLPAGDSDSNAWTSTWMEITISCSVPESLVHYIFRELWEIKMAALRPGHPVWRAQGRC